MMTATALLVLADQGRCRLEDPTGRYLPSGVVDRELVLDPAGMADTWLESSDEAPRRRDLASHDFDGHDITAADLAAFLRALTRGQLVSTGAWSEMTRWRPGPAGYYDDYGLGLGRYRFPTVQVVGHHGTWGAFAFWSPELDAFITGTINTGKVDRRPLLGAVVRALID